jgi:hypothetical protein
LELPVWSFFSNKEGAMFKALLFVLVLAFVTLAGMDYYNGYAAGYKAGYCYGNFICIPPIPPIAPIPGIGQDSL